jgi:hypothetical protein
VIATRGDLLWIADKAGDPFLHLASLASRSIVKSIGRAGEGPGDFASAVDLSFRPGDSAAIWVFDVRLSRLTMVNEEPSPGPIKLLRSPFGSETMRLIWLSRKALLSVQYSDTNRFAVIDSSGRVLHVESGTLLGPDSVPKPIRENLSAGFWICTSPEARMVALLYGGAGRIEYHREDGSFSRLADVPNPSDGVFALNENGHWTTPTPEYYYVGCAADGRFLYALFSGLAPSASRDPRVVEASHVQVFDWAGKFIGDLALDNTVSSIAVIGDSLLIANNALDGSIITFVLPDTIRGQQARKSQRSGGE